MKTLALRLVGVALVLIACRPSHGAAIVKQVSLGGENTTAITSIAIDAQGFIYVAGSTSWPQFPTTAGPLSQYSGGGHIGLSGDVFVQKLTPSTLSVVYSVLVGGSGDDIPVGIAVDMQGYVYVTGTTTSPNFPLTRGSGLPITSPRGFVFKLDPTGSSLVFSTLIGGNGVTPAGIALGPDGAISVAGQVESASLPVTSNAVQTEPLGVDAFLLRLSNDGVTVEYCSYLGGPGTDSATGVAVDSNGDTYVTGIAGSYFPTLATSLYPEEINGGFVTKIDHSSGGLDYSTYLPGAYAVTSICVDALGQVYVAGAAGVGFPTTPGAFQTDPQQGGPFASSTGAFVLELDAQAQSVVFATLIGGSGPGGDIAVSVALSGNAVVIAGYTGSFDFPATDYSLAKCNSASYPPWQDLTLQYPPPNSAFVSSFTHLGKLLNSATYSTACLGDAVTALSAASSSILLADTYNEYQGTTLTELDLSGSASLQVAAVVDSAAFRFGPLVPAQMVTIFGKGLGPTQGVAATLIGSFLPTTIAGTQVTLGGQPMPLLYVSDALINAIVPSDSISVSPAPIVVRLQSGVTSAPLSTYLEPIAPTFFTMNGLVSGQGAIVNQDGTVNSSTNPAPRGSVIAVFGTGGGNAAGYSDGQIVPTATSFPAQSFSYATIGTDLAQIEYIGSAPSGVNGFMQINLRIPMGIDPGPNVLVRVVMSPESATGATQAGVTVAVQ